MVISLSRLLRKNTYQRLAHYELLILATWSFLQAEDAWWVRARRLTLNPNLRSKKMIKNFLRDETGLELSEYAVAAALIALAVVGIFGTLGNNINGVIGNLASKIK